MAPSMLIEGGHVVTVDAAGTEHARGWIAVRDGRIIALGEGAAPSDVRDAFPDRIDASGALVTPGLVNTHHHLYQWLTRGMAQDAILFDWLVALYPTWARIDADSVGAAAAGAMAVLARSGCTTVADHHYVFPRGAGDLVGAIVHEADDLGLRLTATRGSMDLGESDGGLPPDFAVETTDDALAASAAAVTRYHDASPGSMVHVAIAPCSPFSVTSDLLRESATLARDLGARLHTHGSETVEEAAFCQERFGLGPTDYLEDLGWLGADVWMAHCVHMSDHDVARFADTGTGVAHCPSSNARLAAGISPVRAMVDAGVPVGLGVDGAASNEHGRLGGEIRQAVLAARLRDGAGAMSVRDSLRLATIGGARVLGREAEIGSLEPGKLADIAVWELGAVEHAGIADPVAALGLGSLPVLRRLLVHGRDVVADGRLVRADEAAIARRVVAEGQRLRG
ncbi:8-oxoguanine deaminase [Demequina sp. SYSU T00039]|uniref:8-oxoguanine deaminase n=1 Tax=Demequina lignilytica TaxID=3051663 RepID=A0AAW7M4T2_9MICO|nr:MULTISPECIES: 8-oxoguanine deaminase [unclassified Demequina]MDN4478824.1 8-oxoguanine deaminase [Demequina sp. SYSU T00039-1]MDN4488922.1 8-oxoguanine deaminase [Demequina sp. SYSU T00039]